MADEVSSIGVKLSLDASSFNSGLSTAQGKLNKLQEQTTRAGSGAGQLNAGGGSRTASQSPAAQNVGVNVSLSISKTQLSSLRTEIQRGLQNIPITVTPVMGKAAAGEAAATVAAVLTPSVGTRSGARHAVDSAVRQNLPKKATGGPVSGPVIVGDGGRPEVFVPRTTGYVHPSVLDYHRRVEQATLAENRRHQEQMLRHARFGMRSVTASYPNARVDLSSSSRRDRLRMGDELVNLARDYPHTARSMRGIVSLPDPAMNQALAKTYNFPLRSLRPMETFGLTTSRRSTRRPVMAINSSFTDRDVAGIGAYPRNIVEGLIHEFGHAVDFSNAVNDNRFLRAGLASAAPLNKYAAQNPREHFAELFLAHRRGKLPPETARVFETIKLIDRGGRAKGGPVQPLSITLNRQRRAEQQAIEARAIKMFGLTDRIDEAGYLTPSGRLLDFSGRHYAVGYQRSGDRFVPKSRDNFDYLAGQRNVDHRELSGMFRDVSGFPATERMMDKGFIRLQTNGYPAQFGGEIHQAPTEAQMRVLSRWGRAADYVGFDVVRKDSATTIGSEWGGLPGGRSIGTHLSNIRQFYERAKGGPVNIAPVEGNLRHLFAQADPRQYKEGMEWYQLWGGKLQAEAKRLGYAPELLTSVAASLSPRNSWPGNFNDAIKFAEAHKAGLPMPTAGTFGANRRKAWKILDEADTGHLRGIKVQPFGGALLGDPTAKPQDMWMHRAGIGDLTAKVGSPSPRMQRELDRVVDLLAGESGIEARQAQAIIWTVARDQGLLAAGRTRHARMRARGGRVDRVGKPRLGMDFAGHPMAVVTPTWIFDQVGPTGLAGAAWKDTMSRHDPNAFRRILAPYLGYDETFGEPFPNMPFAQSQEFSKGLAERMTYSKFIKKPRMMAGGGWTHTWLKNDTKIGSNEAIGPAVRHVGQTTFGPKGSRQKVGGRLEYSSLNLKVGHKDWPAGGGPPPGMHLIGGAGDVEVDNMLEEEREAAIPDKAKIEAMWAEQNAALEAAGETRPTAMEQAYELSKKKAAEARAAGVDPGPHPNAHGIEWKGDRFVETPEFLAAEAKRIGDNLRAGKSATVEWKVTKAPKLAWLGEGDGKGWIIKKRYAGYDSTFDLIDEGGGPREQKGVFNTREEAESHAASLYGFEHGFNTLKPKGPKKYLGGAPDESSSWAAESNEERAARLKIQNDATTQRHLDSIHARMEARAANPTNIEAPIVAAHKEVIERVEAEKKAHVAAAVEQIAATPPPVMAPTTVPKLFTVRRRTRSDEPSLEDVLGVKIPWLKRAAGGDASGGLYIVNEIGKELFVPKRMSHLIPKDVMAQIPKAGSGAFVIDQPPNSLFAPPEDGLIVPHRFLRHAAEGLDLGGNASPGPILRAGQGQPNSDPLGSAQRPAPTRTAWRWGRSACRGPSPRPGPSCQQRLGTSAAEMSQFAFGLKSAVTSLMAFSAALKTPARQLGPGPQPAGLIGPGPHTRSSRCRSPCSARCHARAERTGRLDEGRSGYCRRLRQLVVLAGPVRPLPRSVLLVVSGRWRCDRSDRGGGATAAAKIGRLNVQPGYESMVKELLDKGVSESEIADFLPGRASLNTIFDEKLDPETRSEIGFAAAQLKHLRARERDLSPDPLMSGARMALAGTQGYMTERNPKGMAAVLGGLGLGGGQEFRRRQAAYTEARMTFGKADREVESWQFHVDKLQLTLKRGNLTTEQATQVQQDLGESQITLSEVEKKRTAAAEHLLKTEKAAEPTQLGIAKNFLAIIGTTTLYGAAMQAANLVMQAALPAMGSWIDQVQGFGSTTTRVTTQLGQGLTEASGNLQATFGKAAQAGGIGAQVTAYLERVLGPSATAKAAGTAEGNASDLFRAAAGVGNAPSGLYGGYGGILGTPFLAGILGGGKGFTEQVAGNLSALSQNITSYPMSTPGQLPSAADQAKVADITQRTTGSAPNPYGLVQGATFDSTKEGAGVSGVAGTPGGLTLEQREKNIQIRQAIGAFTTDINDAAKRGAIALGQADKNFTLVQEDSAKVRDQFAQAGANAGDAANARTMADKGFVLKDSMGNVVTDAKEYEKAWEQIAKGKTLTDIGTYAAQIAQSLRASYEQASAQTAYQMQTRIPAQTAEQLAAQPFLGAATGVLGTGGVPSNLGGSAGKVKSLLAQATRTQNDLTAAVQPAIDAQAAWIRSLEATDPALSGTADQYLGFMKQVTASGKVIAGLQTTIANAQTNSMLVSYANNLRLANRAYQDALGLAGRGGSRLGQMERSQQLLSFGMSQRQINYQVALAGFQAPGLTSEERGARQEQAQIEARYAQRQLNLSRGSLASRPVAALPTRVRPFG